MHLDWQVASVLLIVAGAMVYLARQVRGSAAGKQPGCGHCGSDNGCGSQPQGRPVVTLSPPRDHS